MHSLQRYRNISGSPWLDCCSGNGYRREQALRALNEGAPNAFLCALVLRRLNDWVLQVRAAAREYIPTMAAHTQPEYLVEALWALLLSVHTWGRVQTEDLDVLMNLLSIADVPSRLVSKLIQSTTGPAARILGQVGRTPVLDPFLPILCEQAIQPAVRAKAYRSQLEGCMVWFEGRKWVWTDRRWCQGQYVPVLGERKIRVYRPFLELLAKAAQDDSPIVQRFAGDVLLAKLDDLGGDACPIATRLSTDAYPSVAERGVFAVKRIEG
ncbi:hypothetical protein [Acaryochloris marina]|uniref:hypothetical protein n=1 Tax=Acaryochloris marina TaxID=155978 RepID=UPI000674E9A1|nr:hypothetical protein [Acaryochloris marina]BDM77315.1 hypothetical protein AM10699_01890 [Acaryochloris marina MBIC10699]